MIRFHLRQLIRSIFIDKTLPNQHWTALSCHTHTDDMTVLCSIKTANTKNTHIAGNDIVGFRYGCQIVCINVEARTLLQRSRDQSSYAYIGMTVACSRPDYNGPRNERRRRWFPYSRNTSLFSISQLALVPITAALAAITRCSIFIFIVQIAYTPSDVVHNARLSWDICIYQCIGFFLFFFSYIVLLCGAVTFTAQQSVRNKH